MSCMKQIQLTMSKVAIVDDCDEDLLKYKWRTKASPRDYTFYGIREIWGGSRKKRSSEHLHRVILERKIGRSLYKWEVTDHVDGNGLNNKRDNLRAVTQSENMIKARKRKDNTSGFRGIHWNKEKKGFDVYINFNKKRYRFGRFKNLEEAKIARQQAEIKIWQNT